MLTTVDNPYNPFDDFVSWFLFDVHQGYNTCGRLARLTDIKSWMTEKEKDEEIEKAMNMLIKYDFMNVYKKIRANEKVKLTKKELTAPS